MKSVNVDKLFNLPSTTADNLAVKIQPGSWYFARLQSVPQAAQQQMVQLILQTAQGSLKLPFSQLPGIPTDVPLAISLTENRAGLIDVQVKVLAALPHTITLSARQAQLLQDPQQLAQLQQRILKGEVITHLAGEPIKLPALSQLTSSASGIQLQVIPNHKGASTAVQLSIQPINSEHKLQLPSSELLKPLPFATTVATTPVNVQPKDASHALWRQLLPMLETTPATLKALPELPIAAQTTLALIRQAQPDGSKVSTSAQIIAQLQAALQFQPLQANPAINTGAGTLAAAIQLLLGHLLKTPAPPSRDQLTQRLAQNIGQLDSQQSSQLLRALGTHSSALQMAQLQNTELAATNQQWLIPLALQQQQESRLSQILIEKREAERKEEQAKTTYWQLTMKFDLGQFGQLMAVAKLQHSDLQLQFYTDQPQALKQTEKFLPLLTERCMAQGLTISKAQCQLGKIPDTLGNRRTSLISTKA